MVGILVQLALSWVLVWLIEKKDMGVLGLYPTKQRLREFALFFLITAICSSSYFFLRMYFGERWDINPEFTFKLLAAGLWWHLKSVLFEELIFRGVIFYILIRRLGMVKAIFISAIAFGVYHWFSHEVIGDPVQTTITFVTTGVFGLLCAYGYAKTYSLYIPIAIHLGWNFMRFVFSDGPIGNGVFLPIQPHRIVTVSYFTYGFVIFFPILSALLINFLFLKKRKQAAPIPGKAKIPGQK